MENGMDPKALRQAQDIVKGRGLLGWLTRLFMGKGFVAGMPQAGQALDALQLRQELLASGRAASAKVLAIQDTGALVNFDPVVRLTIEVAPAGEAPFQATFTTPVSKIAIPRIGDGISVRFDPQDRSRIALAA